MSTTPVPEPGKEALMTELDQQRFSRRRLFSLAGSVGLVVAGGVVAESCSSSRSAPAAAGSKKLRPPRGPVAKLTLAGGPVGYPSPFAYFQGGGFDYTTFIFDTLIWKDSKGYIPWLAESWHAAPDGTSWTFSLRDHVLWNDGTPFSASDVAFTFEYLGSLSPAQANIIPGPMPYVQHVATKGNVVTITLSEPYAPFEGTIGSVPIIPEHIWKGVTNPKEDLSPSAVVGTGPYKLASYNETTGSYQFVANDQFFLGKPFVEALDFIPSSNSLVGLKVGQLDGGSPGAEDGVPESVLSSFTQKPNFAMIKGYGGLTRALFFNMKKGFPYNSVAFRQAIAYGIDREALVDRILYGQGVPGSLGDLSPANPWFAQGLPTYPYNPTLANHLLDKAGLTKSNSRMRTLPGGASFQPVIYTSSADRADTADLVLNYVRALSIDASIVSLDEESANATAAKGTYEMMLIFYGGIIGDPDTLTEWFAPGEKIYSFVRVHGYDNPTFASLADQQVTETDRAKRMAMVHEMQHILAEDVPILQLYVPNNLWIYRTDVFDAWYFTPGGVFGGNPGTLNKQVFVTGRSVGL